VSQVAVIMPTHNRPMLLPRAIRSVLAQQNAGVTVYLVVVDDGSVDERAAPMALMAAQSFVFHAAIRVTPSMGSGIARNLGIAFALKSNPDYIAFLDDDDYWRPNHLSVVIKAIEARDPSGDPFPYDAAHALWDFCSQRVTEAGIEETINPPGCPMCDFPNTNCWLIRRQVFERLHPWFPDKPIGEDKAFFTRVRALRVNKVADKTSVVGWTRGGDNKSYQEYPNLAAIWRDGHV
jgi:glycosyltransferase involved in cell wall biosynthesis